MARSWRDAFELGEPAEDGAAGGSAEPDAGRGLFRRLRQSLSKSREALQAELGASLFEQLDDEAWERIEEALTEPDPHRALIAMTELQLETALLAPDGPNIVRARTWLADGREILLARAPA